MKEIFKEIKGLKVFKDESLKRYSSFRIGGKARYLIKVYNQKALIDTMEVIKKEGLKYIVIGEGTNILFGDEGFDGVVIKLMGEFRKIKNEKNIFICGGGALIKTLLKKCLYSGYGGAEFLAGIPGSIGGAIKGNAGAFGRSISEIIKSIKLLNSCLKTKVVERDELDFDYRYSNIPDDSIILGAELILKKMDKKKIKKNIEKFLKLRWEKQPRGHSAGSFFKNPKPFSAGRLIEECGLKGYRIGDAMVSKKHANFIINRGRAKAEDVIKLMEIIKKEVKKKTGILLEPEVRIIK
uniref:UDP-N-acetylenolpyruvoylglucosamine reductase n=1 Tax=candidate division WOR-3 bacterium TaxID=2052148 RepID=A0A7V3RHW0_UNCW3